MTYKCLKIVKNIWGGDSIKWWQNVNLDLPHAIVPNRWVPNFGLLSNMVAF
jgi:hypothetical protein